MNVEPRDVVGAETFGLRGRGVRAREIGRRGEFSREPGVRVSREQTRSRVSFISLIN